MAYDQTFWGAFEGTYWRIGVWITYPDITPGSTSLDIRVRSQLDADATIDDDYNQFNQVVGGTTTSGTNYSFLGTGIFTFQDVTYTKTISTTQSTSIDISATINSIAEVPDHSLTVSTTIVIPPSYGAVTPKMVDSTWDVLTLVTLTQQSSWDVMSGSAIAPKTVASSWNVILGAMKTQDSSWDVAAVAARISSAYIVVLTDAPEEPEIEPTIEDGLAEAYRAPVNFVTRRIEICEADGSTLWAPLVGSERVIEGSISVSYDRDERRQLSLTLSNLDGAISYRPGGFWYDKIIKVYRGLRFIHSSTGEEVHYEKQCGEFMIDTINQKRFPKTIAISGRDYAKKLMNDKITEDIAWAAGTGLWAVVKAVAINGGISKFLEPNDYSTLTAEMRFSRDSSRWDIIKGLCTPLARNAYFTAAGEFTISPFPDTFSDPVAVHYGEADDSEALVDYEISANDTNIFNDIVVRSSNSNDDETGEGITARVTNSNLNSPTCTQKLGRRTKIYESAMFTTEAQALDLANQFLSVSALENFDISFSAKVLPWLEVGTVVLFDDLSEEGAYPERFLLTDFDIPLKLGPMSGTGKRITIVNSEQQ